MATDQITHGLFRWISLIHLRLQCTGRAWITQNRNDAWMSDDQEISKWRVSSLAQNEVIQSAPDPSVWNVVAVEIAEQSRSGIWAQAAVEPRLTA